jgi:hypothetical protein
VSKNNPAALEIVKRYRMQEVFWLREDVSVASANTRARAHLQRNKLLARLTPARDLVDERADV